MGVRRDPFSRTNRRLGYLSGAVVLLACVRTAWLFGDGWSWPLFIWGLAAGLLAILGSLISQWLAWRALALSTTQRADAAAQLQERALPMYLPLFLIGAGIAVVAARLGSPWPDVFLTVTAIAGCILLPLGMLPGMRRRASKARDPDQG